MVHVVGVISGNGEVTVTHHLLGNIDGEGTVDTGPVGLRHFLQRSVFKGQMLKNDGKIDSSLVQFI